MYDVTICDSNFFYHIKNTMQRVGLELTTPTCESCALTSRAPMEIN